MLIYIHQNTSTYIASTSAFIPLQIKSCCGKAGSDSKKFYDI